MNNEELEEIKEELEAPALPTGALLDDRVQELKDKDWVHEELFSGDEDVTWEEKNLSSLKHYSPRNQKGSLSCVMNGICVALEAFEKTETGKTIVFSHKDGYIRRINRPYGGMFMDDAFKIARDGVAYETQVPSMKLNETEINQQYPITNEIIQARAVHASMASIIMMKPTLDKVAAVIATGTPVIPFWFFHDQQAYKEWWKKLPKVEYEELGVYDAESARHQAAGVDFTLHDKKKHLVVQDSAGVGTGFGEFKDLRLVSEDFFNKRCYAVGYLIDKKNLDYKEPEKPKSNFVRDLKVGMTGDDVQLLQKILVHEGVMNIKTPTKYFGGMTMAGVKKLQEKYKAEILTPVGLKTGTGYFGSSTRKWVQANYGD